MSQDFSSSPAPAPTPAPRATSRLDDFAVGLVVWIARHWLAIFNTAWGLYAFLPFLAPTFMAIGWDLPARAIYGIYSFTCHQLPDHSFFLFGETHVPLEPALIVAGAPDPNNLFLFRSFIGNTDIGYKVALCERDVAIYGSVFLSGLVFGIIRKRRPIRAPASRSTRSFLIPIAVDGLTQLVGLRESNWWLRTLTGALFGAASVWLAYPYIDEAMQDVIDVELRRPAPPTP